MLSQGDTVMNLAKDYSGKKVFVGIDVHKRTYAVSCIIEGALVHLCTTKADSFEFSKSLRHWFKGATLGSYCTAALRCRES